MGRSKSNPDGVYRRESANGATAFVAQVRVKPFRPISKSFSTKPAATEWADSKKRELLAQRKHGADRTDLSSLTVRTLVDEFLGDPETKALRYFEELERNCGWWAGEYGSIRATDLGVLKLRDARDKLQATGKAAGTVNRILSAFRSCWNWGRAAGLIAREHSWPTRLLLTEPRGRTRYLTDDELASLIAAAHKHSPTMYAAIVFSLSTGVRQSELLRLERKDVDFARQRVRILVTKNDEARAVHLPEIAAEALKAIFRNQVVGQRFVFLDSDGEPLTKDTLILRWKKIRSAAKLKDFRWHDLRHSCASFLAQKGASLLEIGSVLGHKSPSVTMRYAHLVSGAPVTGHAALDEKLRLSSKT